MGGNCLDCLVFSHTEHKEHGGFNHGIHGKHGGGGAADWIIFVGGLETRLPAASVEANG